MKNQELNIEDIMFPNNGKLEKTEWGYISTIVDAEIDPLEVQFNGDDCIEINTKDYTYIKLTIENLYQLIHLAEKI